LATIEEADIRNKPKLYLILLVGLVLLLASSTISCGQNPRYIYENGVVEVGGDGEPIELINNPNATNPTYAELVAFIKEDSTDEHPYRDESFFPVSLLYVCSDFAQDVHNNAEVAGIRAAWVGIDFEGDGEGHALNAFETTDKGLVYIDCTGGGSLSPLLEYNATSWDTVAYVEIGKEYGLIDIAEAESPSYSFYEGYKQKWQEYEKMLSDYNDEVMQYNQEITTHKIPPMPSAPDTSKYGMSLEETRKLVAALQEWEAEMEAWEAEMEAWEAKMVTWEARLEEKSQEIDELGEELGDFWFEALGIVEDAQIHW